MSQTPPIARPVQALLDQNLPANGRVNTFVLGERHDEDAHFAWLQEHLDTLIAHHDVRTIGREMPVYENLFLWAYQDGTLERALGSKEKARAYLHAVLPLDTTDIHKEHFDKEIDFLTAAMDKGVRVVGYDTRNSFAKMKLAASTVTEVLEAYTASKARETEQTTADAYAALRTDPARMARLFGREAGKTSTLGFALEFHELDWLLQQNPDYRARLNTLEHLVVAGHLHIEDDRISSDGLSAVMFDAMATREGNRLLIAGQDHVDGIYWLAADEAPGVDRVEQVYGGLPQHLFALGQAHPHQVTGSVTAGIAVTNEKQYRNHVRGKQKGKIVDSDREDMTLIHVASGRVTTVPLAQLNAEKTLAYLEPLETPVALNIKNAINPRRTPRLDMLARQVDGMMNGPEPGLER